jgi:hypothetical protein
VRSSPHGKWVSCLWSSPCHRLMIGRKAANWSTVVVVAIWILLEWHQFMEPMFPAILVQCIHCFPTLILCCNLLPAHIQLDCFPADNYTTLLQLITKSIWYQQECDNMLRAVSSMTTITCHNVGVGFPMSSLFMLGVWIFDELNDIFFIFLVVVDNWPVATDSWEISTEREQRHW